MNVVYPPTAQPQVTDGNSYSLTPVATSASRHVIRSGIGGIERAKATDTQISKAFEDLDQLMEMAKPMVSLAKNISGKIKVRMP